MNSVSQSGRSQALNLPNLLTYGRVAAVPVVCALLFWPHDDRARWPALFVFILAGITDYLDVHDEKFLSPDSATTVR